MAKIEIKKQVEEDIIREGDVEIDEIRETVTEKITQEPEIEPGGEPGEDIKEISDEEKDISDRKKKIADFLKANAKWGSIIVLIFLIIALILGVYIRSLPMMDHNPNIPGNQPGLWDITTDTWTLGPDLDPFLFMRYADYIVSEGGLPETDFMRNVPLGFDTSKETRLLPYMIAGTYKLFNTISFGVEDVNIQFAAAILPVIMFALTIISFFLFVREIFVKKDKQSKTRANIIALISTFFMIVIPAFLPRTIAGIPEKESAAFFFMFLAFYLFLKAWKSEKKRNSIILGVLAGISTALMGLIWGGMVYVFVSIAMGSLIAFVLNKVHKKEFLVYSSWLVVSWAIMLIFSNRFTFKGLLMSLTTGTAFFIFIIFLVDFILWNTKLKNIRILKKTKIPNNIKSIICAIILGILGISLMFGPGFIFSKIGDLNQILFKPVAGRWGITVAENRQPYFTEWASNFGPYLLNKIPIVIILFFIGSVVLFKRMLYTIKKKDSWILTALYLLFLFGLVFSRYSPQSVFNGENFISGLFYYGSSILLAGSLIYYYIKYHKEENLGFEKINYEFLLLFSLLALCLFTARSAVRLIMVLAIIAPIFLSFLVVFSVERFRKSKEDTSKVILGAIALAIIVLSIFAFYSFYKETRAQAYSYIPSSYSQQWQKAMQWVRENTKENSVFAHWWDYGYWVQTLGKRATVVDGGNIIVYWNYLMGRHVLTGDNQKTSLEFLYNHNATHLLIDSTDIGKYTAFSSIGSDINYDRYSWIPTMPLDEKQSQEMRNSTLLIYNGGFSIDEDIVYKGGEKEIFLPANSAALLGVTIESKRQGTELSFGQPEGVFYYQGQQYSIPLKYIYYNGDFAEFEQGIEATAYLIPLIEQGSGGVSVKDYGALIYISPKIMRGFLAQKYLLNDPFNNFPNFKITYTQPSPVVEALRAQQNIDLDDFVYFYGTQGPIKIWGIEYTGKEQIKDEYLDTDSSKYLDWEL